MKHYLLSHDELVELLLEAQCSPKHTRLQKDMTNGQVEALLNEGTSWALETADNYAIELAKVEEILL